MNRCNFTSAGGGANNYVRMDSHADGANGNTANVNYQTFKLTSSTIQFSKTTVDFQYNSANSSGAFVGYTDVDTDQNITLANTRQMTASTNGSFSVNCSMSTSDSHVSPVIDLDRMSVITIENDIDDAVISANDINVTSRGAGYTNTAPNAYTATFTAPDRSDGVTATANVHVEVTLNVNAGEGAFLQSGNSYSVTSSNSAQFVIGEGVRTVASHTDGGVSADPTGDATQTTATISGTAPGSPAPGLVDAACGIIVGQTFVGGVSTANVASITIKTSANSFGVFANGTYIVADSTAQQTALTNSGKTASSNTFAVIGTVTGLVSNVVPWPVNATTGSPAGSGYLTSPTITISAPFSGTDTATAIVTGEDKPSGGNINTRYISRRVTLEDGFDASDISLIMNAYKPVDTGIEVYYKVKSDEDPEDFDLKGYTLMTQETASTVYSLNEEDTREFTFKTTNNSAEYTSGGTSFDRFKTFAIKIVLTSKDTAVVPKVRDMRAVALDT